MEFQIQGLNELVSKMNSLPLALGTQKNILARSARSSMEPVENRASELAPVYDGPIRMQKRHGRTYYLIPGKLAQGMMTTIAEQTATGVRAKTGPVRGAWYGVFEEFGTTWIPADSFLRRAFDEKLDEVVSIFGYSVAAAIEREMAA